MRNIAISLLMLVCGAFAHAGGNSGSGGTRPTMFSLPADPQFESVKALTLDRGEITFGYKAFTGANTKVFKLRAEEFTSDQQKHLLALRRSLSSGQWVAVEP